MRHEIIGNADIYLGDCLEILPIACNNLNRKFIGIEINQEFFEIALKRIEIATRQGTLDFGSGD